MENTNKEKRKTIYRIIIIIVLLFLLIKGCSIVREELINNNGKDTFNINCKGDNCVKLLEIKDDGKSWKSKTSNEIDIFKKEYINPEDNGIYNFKINNNIKKPVAYSIKFVEKNPNKINLKYRLKQNKKYINKDWMSIDKIAISNSKLIVNENDDYQLEWKWFSSDNDNDVAGIEEDYKIKIIIDSEA